MTTQTNFLFENRPDDLPPIQLEVEGAMPDAIRGRFLANGPGRSHVGRQKLHIFDAHGRILSAHVQGGGVTLRGNHVQTPVLRAEIETDQLAKRRLFANKPSRWSNLLDLDLANTASHNVYPFAGKIVAAQDPGHFILDTETLDVTGRVDCGGLFKKGMNATPMPRVDPASGRLVLWLQKPGPKDTVTMVELDESLAVAQKQTCKLPSGLMHDVAFTQNHYVMSRFASLSVLKVLWGASPAFDALRFGDETPVLYLIPKRGGEPKIVPLPRRMHFHYFNAFEDDGSVVLDTIGYPGKVTFNAFYPDGERERLGQKLIKTPIPQVVRYRIALDTFDVEERIMPEIACEAPEVSPSVRGRPYRYGYATARSENDHSVDPGGFAWFGGIGKLDFENNHAVIWSGPAGCTCSPPAFVADPEREGEDAGFLLSWIQDPQKRTSSLAVLDAQNLERGPVAQAHHQELFGFVSHTSFLESDGEDRAHHATS